MSDILDLIDGAIEDYASPDAMRWTPEPPKATPIAFRPWTDQEIALMRERMQADLSRFSEGLREFAEAVKPAFAALGDALRAAYVAMQPVIEARSEHRRQLHCAYRQRALARRRRSR